MNFLVFNADFSSPGPNPLGSRRPVQAGVKYGYPIFPKNGYFTAMGSFNVQTVADRHFE